MRKMYWIWLVLLLLTGCPETADKDAADQVSEPAERTAQTAESPASAAQSGPPAQGEDPFSKQLIILYTGDTFSNLTANDSYDPPEGGLSALTNTVASYLSSIARFNRLKVESEGGDPAGYDVSFAGRRTGEHPFMLIDYGGWERPNDPFGELHVELQFEMYRQMNYDAVGLMLADQLTSELWAAYNQAFTVVPLLSGAGYPPQCPPSLVSLCEREVHGEYWGITLVPSAPPGEGPRDSKLKAITIAMQQDLDWIAEYLEDEGCSYNVLCAAGGTAEFYNKLATDKRFDIVLGVHGPAAIADGHGALPADGPLMLPDLAPGGRELGVCHLYYQEGESYPSSYYFSRKPVEDEPDQPWPYRDQVAEVQAEHTRLLAELRQELEQAAHEQ